LARSRSLRLLGAAPAKRRRLRLRRLLLLLLRRLLLLLLLLLLLCCFARLLLLRLLQRGRLLLGGGLARRSCCAQHSRAAVGAGCARRAVHRRAMEAVRLAMLFSAAGVLLIRARGTARRASAASRLTRSDSFGGGSSSEPLRPPFPPQVATLLDAASLCYLATATENTPHLSLMCMTWDRESEQLLFSTRRDTQKARNLSNNPRVCILLTDYPTLKSQASAPGYARTGAVTLYGEARVLPDGPETEQLRAKHLANNPSQSVFIAGPGVAIVAILVESARICNASDKVSSWSVAGGWSDESGGPGRSSA
jgi:general stress protein 26